MKNYFINVTLVVILCMIASCDRHIEPKDGVLCKCLFTELGGPDENYMLEITTDSIMKVSSGRLTKDFYREVFYEDSVLKGNLSDFRFFDRVTMQKEKKLNPGEFDELKTCISGIKDIDNLVNPFIQSNWHDTWAVVVIVGEKKYVFVHIPTPELKVFLDIIMRLSPVELKDERYKRELSFSYIYDEPWLLKTQPFKKSTWERIREWFK